MKLKQFNILFLLLTGLLLTACSTEQPKMTLEASNLNLGHVVNGNIISREVTVRNEGEANLVIERLATSCGCTKAALDPMTIAPGASGTLTIEFDSGAHGPDLTGEIIRQVFIASNDPNQPDAQIELVVFVDPKSS